MPLAVAVASVFGRNLEVGEWELSRHGRFLEVAVVEKDEDMALGIGNVVGLVARVVRVSKQSDTFCLKIPSMK